MKRFLFTILAFILTTLTTFSVSDDFKNNLTKIDIVKTSENSYRIDLHTQKPYSTPIKVIKKGNNNYNILLPETNNSITSGASNEDIKSVDVKLQPYAGQDINNGYTKIIITTNRELKLTTNVKAETKETNVISKEKLAQIDKEIEAIQKGTKTDLKPSIENKESANEKIAQETTNKNIIKNEKIAQKTIAKTKKQATAKNNTVQKTNIKKTTVKKVAEKKQATKTVNKGTKPQEKLAQNPIKNEKENVQNINKPAETKEETKEVSAPITNDIENKTNSVEPTQNIEETILADINAEQESNIIAQSKETKSKKTYGFIDFIKNNFMLLILFVGIISILINYVRQKEKSVETLPEYEKTDSIIDEQNEIEKIEDEIKEVDDFAIEMNETKEEIKPNDDKEIVLKKPAEEDETIYASIPETLFNAKTNPVEQIKKDVEITQKDFETTTQEINDIFAKTLEENKEKFAQKQKITEVQKINKFKELKEKRAQEEVIQKQEFTNKKETVIEPTPLPELPPESNYQKLQTKVEFSSAIKTENEKQIEQKPQVQTPINNFVTPTQKVKTDLNIDKTNTIKYNQDNIKRIQNIQINKPTPLNTPPKVNNTISKDSAPTITLETDKIINKQPQINKQITKSQQTMTQNPIKQNTQEETEAKIISSIKIESDRGFYLAQFRGKISLIGFVNEEIFIIHTFKNNIEDLRIKYRLVDSSMDKDYYMVKVDNSKFLIKSTKLGFKLELAI